MPTHLHTRALLLFLCVAFLISGCGGPASSGSPASPSGAAGASSAEALNAVRSKGDANAPITLIEFSDYQCPYCAAFETQTMAEIDQLYIQTGKVRFIYKDFPLPIHTSAIRAAHAAHCAADQDHYWEMHDQLFTHQKLFVSDPQTDLVTFQGLASDIGIDSGQFAACMQSNKYLDRITKSATEGASRGVSATPTYLLDDQLVVGLYPAARWKELIEQALARHSGQG